MKLLGNTKNKINRDKDGGKKTHLEITKVLIVLCNIVYNDHQQDQRVLCAFVPNKSLG